LFCDEIGFLSIVLLQKLEEIRLMNPHLKFILSGDILNQFQAPLFSWMGKDLNDIKLWNSELLYNLAAGRILELTKNMRSDPVIFSSLSKPLHSLRRIFPPTKEPVRWHLVVTHRMRRILNERENAPNKNKEHVCIKATDDPKSQDMYLCVGTPLIACKTVESRGIFNSAHYSVSCLNPLTVAKIATVTAAIKEEPIPVGKNEIGKLFFLGHSMTTVSSQGKTLPGRVAIWETHHLYFSRKHLVVALSRATSSELLSIQS